MTTVLQGLTNFLAAEKDRGVAPDLLARWNPGMETQVLVSSVGGWPVEEKQGCFTNGKEFWWHVRVPKHADSEPEFNDYPLTWFFEDHAECIGSTGWNWRERRSCWLGFDFDALVGHAKGVGIEDAELDAVKEKARALPYVEVRRSTGGAGLHLYVHVDVATENHTVHSALARCVLGMMTTATGFDFASRIDCCGGNMWIWRKDLEPGGPGLELLKAATHQLVESDLPTNWRDNIAVVQKGRGKVATDKSIATLATSIKQVALDDEHRALIEALGENYTTVWSDDYNCLHTKTKGLQDIFEAGGIRGIFRTVCEGNNPDEPNCYMFPLEGGAWKVYRFGNAAEANTWTTDNAGRTTCYFNKPATLKSACLFYGGVEDADTGEFEFSNPADAIGAARCLGEALALPEAVGRKTRLGMAKDGRLLVKLSKTTSEPDLPGWLTKGKWYQRILNATLPENQEQSGDFDNVFRKIIEVDGTDAGWVIRNKEQWVGCNKDDVKNCLESLGVAKNRINCLLGDALFDPWVLVNLPFQDEYPGGRQWNLNAPQLAFEPSEGDHPTWDLVLNHCGQELDACVRQLDWCSHSQIGCGGDYLKAWIACMLRFPFEPLPYLFFYGEQNCGKSSFHEATALLMTKGAVKANRVLKANNDFNGELENAILCFVEEETLPRKAYSAIKDYVTSLTIAIRKMRTNQFMTANTTKWVHVANDRDACPIFSGDTRIVAMKMEMPAADIPKEELRARLVEEAPAFMHTLLTMSLPERMGRLRLPVIETDSKRKQADENRPALDVFVTNELVREPGAILSLNEFNEAFSATYSLEQRAEWAKGVNSTHLKRLSPPIATVRGSKGMNLVDVRWANPFALSV